MGVSNFDILLKIIIPRYSFLTTGGGDDVVCMRYKNEKNAISNFEQISPSQSRIMSHSICSIIGLVNFIGFRSPQTSVIVRCSCYRCSCCPVVQLREQLSSLLSSRVVPVIHDAVVVVAIDDKKMKVDFCWKVVSYPVDVVELELSLLSSITLLVLLSLM